VFVCLHVYTCIHTYTYISHTSQCLCVYVCTCVHMCSHIHAYMAVPVCRACARVARVYICVPKNIYICGKKGAFVASLPQSLIEVKQLLLLCRSSIYTYVTVATQHMYTYIPTYVAAPLTLGPGVCVCVCVCLCVFTQSHLATRKRRRQRNQRYHSLPAPSSITLLLCSSTRRGQGRSPFCF